jgi:hypothetical protein
MKCINSFSKKTVDFELKSVKLLAEINNFYDENSKQLIKFKIDDIAIKEELALADS